MATIRHEIIASSTSVCQVAVVNNATAAVVSDTTTGVQGLILHIRISQHVGLSSHPRHDLVDGRNEADWFLRCDELARLLSAGFERPRLQHLCLQRRLIGR